MFRPTAPATTHRTEAWDAVRWLLIVAAGLAVTALAVHWHARLGTAGAPFIGRYRVKLDVGSLLAPAIAAGVLFAVGRRWHETLPWRWLLALGYLAALAWALGLALVDGGNGLAGALSNPQGYLPDIAAVGHDPLGFLRHFVGHAGDFTVATRQHPPAPVLLLWGLDRIGVTRPVALGLVLTALGCLSVPLVTASVRSLCHEPAARRLLPVLVLAPYAVWLAVSMDAVTLTVCAGFICCGVIGSEPRRSPWWAAASGLLMGLAALFSYSVVWLAVTVIVVYFVRRRALLVPITGASALVPLALARLAGFVWPDGLTAAQADFSLRVGPHRSWLVWIFLDLLVLVIGAGPALVPAARKWRLTPGWPFLVGAGLAVGFALGSGLSRGEVERSWLPFFPWLLVAAVAAEDRAAADRPSPTPVLLIGLGALTAVVLEAVLRTTW